MRDMKATWAHWGKPAILGSLAIAFLGSLSYVAASYFSISLMPYYYRWFDGGAKQSLGEYVIHVDHPWWIDSEKQEGIALYRPQGVDSKRITVVRMVWDPEHRIDLQDDETARREETELMSGYMVAQVKTRNDGNEFVVARRVRNDLVIFVSCIKSPTACVGQMPKIENSLRIYPRSKDLLPSS